MEYNKFIAIIIQHQTNQVTALSYPECSSMKNVPEEFELFLPQIVKIIDTNFVQICQKSSTTKIAIIGIEMPFGTIESEIPMTTNRIFNIEFPKRHFCSILTYLELSPNEKKPESWDKQKTLIVDFTTGNIMSNDCFISFVFEKKAGGTIYGQIDCGLVEKVWQLIKRGLVDRKIYSKNNRLVNNNEKPIQAFL